MHRVVLSVLYGSSFMCILYVIFLFLYCYLCGMFILFDIDVR